MRRERLYGQSCPRVPDDPNCHLLSPQPCSTRDGPSRQRKGFAAYPDPEALAIEMAKALVSGDRERFTALAATREEMEEMLKTAWPPTSPEDRQLY